MPHSKASICNSALGKLGKFPLVQDADAPQEYHDAQAVCDSYDRRIGRTLRSQPWNFATRRAAVDRIEAAPAFGYAYQYPFPTAPAVARIWTLDETFHGKDPDFKVEGKFILSNDAGPLHVVFIADIRDPAEFDEQFAEAMADVVAEDAAVAVLGSLEAAQWFERRSQKAQSEAKGTDNREKRVQVADGGSWLTGRSTG